MSAGLPSKKSSNELVSYIACRRSCVLFHRLTRNEDLVLVFLVAVRQDVRTLERLREEAEDVVDDQDSLGRSARPGHICLQSIDCGLLSSQDGREDILGRKRALTNSPFSL